MSDPWGQTEAQQEELSLTFFLYMFTGDQGKGGHHTSDTTMCLCISK